MTVRDGRTRRAWVGRGSLSGLVMLALGAVMGCTPIQSMHGYVPDEEALALIEPGVDTRETVAAFLGRPTTDGILNDEAWYYVQSRFKATGIRAAEEYDRQVVAVTFDPAGRVANIERFGLERGRVVPLSRRVTTEPIKGRSVLAQIFGNFGRLDASNIFKDR